MQDALINGKPNADFFPAVQNVPGQASLADFNALVLAHQDAVYSLASYLLGDPDLAEDVTQKAFLNAFLKLHTFRGGSFRNWVLGIVKNASFDELRRARRRPAFSLDALDDGSETTPEWSISPAQLPEQALERKERSNAVAAALRGLKADYRAAVVLVDFQGLDYADAAQVLGVPIGTLKSRVSRARRQLTAQPALQPYL